MHLRRYVTHKRQILRYCYTSLISLVAAFDTLITDVRSRVNNVASIAEFYVTHAQELLPLILAGLPVPISLSLSYDWTPDIQDWEPVFTLEVEATFTVSAAATVALTNLTTQPAIQPSFDISATLTKFSINLIGTPSFVIVDVASLQFTSQGGNTPNCHLDSMVCDSAMPCSSRNRSPMRLIPPKDPSSSWQTRLSVRASASAPLSSPWVPSPSCSSPSKGPSLCVQR